VIDGLKNKYSIKYLCSKLKCSRSGYYDWIVLGKPQYKAYDEILNKLILEQLRLNIEIELSLVFYLSIRFKRTNS